MDNSFIYLRGAVLSEIGKDRFPRQSACQYDLTQIRQQKFFQNFFGEFEVTEGRKSLIFVSPAL